MKIITIKQPWATLIAEGYKEYEFRSWKTKYRGPILIHAGQGVDKGYMDHFSDLNLTYPKSQVVAIANLDDCILVDNSFNDELHKKNKEVYGLSNKTGLYAWKLSNIKKINSKDYIKGQLGLWNIEL